jgi:tRNA1Val (adenine37-N6)-methyltransferase
VESEELTIDEVRRFGLQVAQPVSGYRFSLDALLLADFVKHSENDAIIDLGTGCGVIALILACCCAGSKIAAVENNPFMAGIADRNVEMNGLSGQITVLGEDVLALRKCYQVSSFDLVVSNPPFRRPGTGRISPCAGRDAARHETSAGLADFLSAAKYLVKPTGKICFIQHPSRLSQFISLAAEMKLTLLRLRMIHSHAGSPASMFMAELAKGRRSAPVVESPLFVRDGSGNYSEEVAEILGSQDKKTSEV